MCLNEILNLMKKKLFKKLIIFLEGTAKKYC